MKFKNHKNIALVLSCMIILQNCSQKKSEQAFPADENSPVEMRVKLTDAQFRNAGIRAGFPEKINVGHVVMLNGKTDIMPENNITVSSPMSGIVRQLKIIPGMHVQKGQALLRLEDKECIQLQQDYLTAKNGLSFSRLEFERQAELAKNRATSDKILQTAEEKLRQQQIMVTSLAEKLKLININPASVTPENIISQIVIHAPASGHITEVMTNQGKYVQAGENLIQMSGSEGLKLVVKVFEKDLPFIRNGQKIVAYTNAEPDKKIPGSVEYIVSRVNAEGFSNVICKPDVRSDNLIAGMYINAEIEAKNVESYTVPDESLIRFEGREYVFIDKGGLVFEMQEVETGQKDNNKIQILNAEDIINQKVVYKGAYTLLMKMKNVRDE